ncbi:MAG: homoserine O-succinyltransferase [Helicobacter sp.]|uniref:homoserine O-succinyltransferase n=1 Tax=Helicobacter sp. 10-6591 TaxID=2004998 RepID=UPI000DCE243A|nr:homoserine O-succinyltransferase [Helicobacter sp. 10-6591]MCI7484692.1 homoserine O-succinyltransferase [Helicobacter sp.]MDD7567561.1 homoserine O-succinyltransferase [Helicobacter sp.]MDY5741157.1 homoserine O-succinyltransferase [Helicobacter sp.]RAX55914.1 homoserine O-succinyltransferase [Helicobacter sp. 10-6591]
MPLIIPDDIPAFEILAKSAFVMANKRAQTQDIRPLRVLVCNLMPTKIETENQILSLLANSPLQVEITLLATKSYVGKNTPLSHLRRFYVNFEDVQKQRFDGAIVTGAPIEHLKFEEVKYWKELVSIMQFLDTNCTSTMYLCWGAMAGLYYFYGINKTPLKQKLFGIFPHTKVCEDALLNGLDELVKIPHSRHCHINQSQLSNNKALTTLLKGRSSGASVIKDKKNIFILGHPEYARDTLLNEYQRDLDKGLAIATPKNYLKNGTPILSWRSSASVLFANWLNFYVYQSTPYKL